MRREMVRANARPLCEFDVYEADGSRETFAVVQCLACKSVVAIIANAAVTACGICAASVVLATQAESGDVEDAATRSSGGACLDDCGGGVKSEVA